MMRCHHCGNYNLKGAEFCDDCGIRMSKESESTLATPPPPSFLGGEVTPQPARPLSPVGKLFEEDSSDNGSATTSARLEVMISGRPGKEFWLNKAEVLIGRWDSTRGIFPDVDLDDLDLETKVSRRHARIIHRNNQYWLEDLGSLNGTVVNRRHRLQKGQPYLLKDGDEIIVGKTFLKFSIA